jgi:uncharacterized protein involved in outer membrane biogenesis
VEERTGRSFLIEDDLELTFFPWLGVQTGGVHLGNIEGFGEEPFASAEKLTARVRLLPLIQRRVELGTIELDGLELNLARNQAGLMNWESLLTQTSNNDSISAETSTDNSPLIRDLNVAGLSIRDGIIFWRENLTEVRYVLSELSLDTGPITINEPIDASLAFQLISVDPTFSATFDATSTASFDISKQHYVANNLELEFRLEDGQHDERAVGKLQANIEFSAENNSIQITDAQIQADLINPPLGPEKLNVQASTEQGSLNLENQTAEVADLRTTVGGITTNWQLSEINLIDTPRLAGKASMADASVEDALNILGVNLESNRDIGNFDLSSSFTIEMGTGNFSLNEVQGTALGIGFEGELATTAGETTGKVQTIAFDPAALISLLPSGPLEKINISEINNLALNTGFFIGVNQVFSLRNFNATIPGAKITGALDRLENGERLRGRLETNEISPDLFLTIFPDLLPEYFNPDKLRTVSLNTSFDYRAKDDSLQLDRLNANVMGLRTAGDLMLQNLSNEPEIRGQLEVEQFSPKALFERLYKDFPATSDPSALSTATISATLTVNSEQGNLESIRMRLDDTNITGQLSVENFGDPTYSFNFIMDELNLDRYLAPIETGREESVNEERSENDLLLPTKALNLLAIEGQLAVTDLRAAGLKFSNISTNLLIENGVARVDSSNADFYGGKLEGGIELDARAGASLLSMHGSGIAIELGSMMTDSSEQALISGIGTLDLQLSGNGKTLNDSLANASGYFDFSVQNGVIQGVNLNHELCDAFNRLKNYPRPPANQEQFTEFLLLRGKSRVNDGIASTNDLLATTPNLKISAQGRMDLSSKNLNYDVDAEMTEVISIPQCNTLDDAVGYSIPLKLSGTTTKPIILPDFGQLLLQEAQEVIRDVLLERLFGN